MPAEITSTKASVVLVGSFNPRIFHPDWLAAKKLIGRQEAAVAIDAPAGSGEGLEIINRDIAIMRLSWLDLTILPERFSAQVKEEPVVRARDFVVRCFQILEHTPITSLGINREAVLQAPNETAWHALGDALAPKGPWATLGGNEHGRRVLGLRNLSIERKPRPDQYDGHILVSLKGQPRFRTAVEVNDHYDVAERDDSDVDLSPARRAIQIIKDQWDNSIERADRVIAELARIE